MRQVAILGDSLEVVPTFRKRSYGAIVTDPPYGLRFMGKMWDSGVPGAVYWRTMIGALMPGGYMVAFGGTRTYHRLTCAIEDAGFEIVDCLMWLHGQGFPKGRAQLKPAWEPIVLARRPSVRVLSFNIDGCRIETSETIAAHHGTGGGNGRTTGEWFANYQSGDAGRIFQTAGRWPANVILDEVSAAMLDEQVGERQGSRRQTPTHSKNAAFGGGRYDNSSAYADTGGASRFFYCPKASPSERGAYNDWATVKPLALMRWLVRLIGRKGWPILDPFCGSGTTLLACMLEGFDGTGIDSDPHAIEITNRRLADRQRRVMGVPV